MPAKGDVIKSNSFVYPRTFGKDPRRFLGNPMTFLLKDMPEKGPYHYREFMVYDVQSEGEDVCFLLLLVEEGRPTDPVRAERFYFKYSQEKGCPSHVEVVGTTAKKIFYEKIPLTGATAATR